MSIWAPAEPAAPKAIRQNCSLAEAVLALFLIRSSAKVLVSSSLSSSSTSRPLTIAPTGLIRSWQTREHSSAARSSASRAIAGHGRVSAGRAGCQTNRRIAGRAGVRCVIHRTRCDRQGPGTRGTCKRVTREITPQQAEQHLDALTAIVSRAAAAIARHAVFIGRTAHQDRPLAGHRRRRGLRSRHPGRLSPAAARRSGDLGGNVGRAAAASLEPSFVLVDPLDGTREFLAGRDEFTVNIAHRDDGRSDRRHRRRAGARPALARRRRRQAPSGCGLRSAPARRKPTTAASIRTRAGAATASSWRRQPLASRRGDRGLPGAAAGGQALAVRLGAEILPARRRRGRRLSAARRRPANGTSPPAMRVAGRRRRHRDRRRTARRCSYGRRSPRNFWCPASSPGAIRPRRTVGPT